MACSRPRVRSTAVGGSSADRTQLPAPRRRQGARPGTGGVVVPETLVRVATRAGERAGVGQQGPVALQQHPILPQQPHQRRVALHQRQQLAIDRCAGGHPRQPQPLEHRGRPGAEARADGDRPGQAGRRHHGAHLLVRVGIHRGGGDRRRVDGRPPTYRWVQPTRPIQQRRPRLVPRPRRRWLAVMADHNSAPAPWDTDAVATPSVAQPLHQCWRTWRIAPAMGDLSSPSRRRRSLPSLERGAAERVDG